MQRRAVVVGVVGVAVKRHRATKAEAREGGSLRRALARARLPLLPSRRARVRVHHRTDEVRTHLNDSAAQAASCTGAKMRGGASQTVIKIRVKCNGT
jgi:hypothetical protein